MFDGLLGKNKFFSRCKSKIKETKGRIEMIMKRRSVVQKYLRNDIVDLLKNDLDVNAYGRAEGLLAEMNRSECYELLDQFCCHCLANLKAMKEQSKCPEDCREAVSSLVYAAARFSDLPELRDLRSVFSNRYGDSVDIFVSKMLMEKLKSGVPPKELKLKLLQQIAKESDLKWSSKSLENKLYKECKDNHQDLAMETKHEHEHENEPEPQTMKDIKVAVESNRKVNAQVEAEENQLLNKFKSIPPPYIKPHLVENEDVRTQHDPVPKPSPSPSPSPSPRPRSVRTRHMKHQEDQVRISPSQGDEGEEDLNRANAKQGQRILKFFDNEVRGDRDHEEEEIMDELLKHYSTKSGPRRSDSGVATATKRRDGVPPHRVSSLPTGLTAATESPRRHTRAASLQPDLLKGNANHVHPKLPEYDEFVARLATFRAK